MRAMPKLTKGTRGKARPAAKVRPAARAAKATGQDAGKTSGRATAATGKATGQRARGADPRLADAGLFAPLTEGERADALRCLLEDERLRAMAKVGRYRVITVEPLVVKPPEPLANRRLARVVIYDYAADRCVDACVDLDRGAVCFVGQSTAQPMLSRDEEHDAIAIALRDERVTRGLRAGDAPVAVMHYWSHKVVDLAYRRRSAAVLFGQPGTRPNIVAVVDLIDGVVGEVVPAEQW